MTDSSDPTDHARTTRSRAGLVMKDGRQLPGLALVGVALAAFVGCLTAVASGSTGWAVGLGVVAGVLVVAGIVWLLVERRRVARLTGAQEQ